MVVATEIIEAANVVGNKVAKLDNPSSTYRLGESIKVAVSLQTYDSWPTSLRMCSVHNESFRSKATAV